MTCLRRPLRRSERSSTDLERLSTASATTAHVSRPTVPDYDSYPLWLDTAARHENVDPSAIGLSPELSERLLLWSDAFDATLVRDHPARSGFPTPSDESAFIETGRALAAQVVSEWGDRGPVTYYDVSTQTHETAGL